MALYYDNDGENQPPVPGEEHFVYNSPYFSEIEANTVENLDVKEDWAGEGVKALTIWHNGHPKADGKYTLRWEDPVAQTYGLVLEGRGRDIGGRYDELYFTGWYPWIKPAGASSFIQGKVNSVDNTSANAKAGLMIREKMTPYARYAAVFVTPGNQIVFQWRAVENGPTTSVSEGGPGSPLELKLERIVTGEFKAWYRSGGYLQDVNNPTTGNAQLVNIADFNDTTHVGLAVTSNNADAICAADFNNLSLSPETTAGFSGNVGLNDAEQMYVALKDGSGAVSVVKHPDPNAAIGTSWREWNIDLVEFGSLDFNSIKKVYIGFGDRDVPAAGGSGIVYIDDFRVCPPRCVPSKAKPLADIYEDPVTGYDCTVAEEDLAVLIGDWLMRDELITTQIPSSGPIAQYLFEGNFLDSVGTNHGDPQGDPTIVYDAVRASNVVDLDGIDQCVLTDANAIDLGIDGNSPKTVTAWAYTRSFNNGGIFDMGNRVAGQEFCLRTQTTVDLWRTQLWGYPTWDIDFSYPTENAWVHFALAYDGNEVTVYANGNIVANRTLNLNTAGDIPFLIGRYNVSDYFNGRIDDVRVYNYGLSQAEVAYIAADGAGSLHLPILSPADLYQGELQGQQWINFRDYSVIAGSWLDKVLWP
jgi:hypothetical protein